MRVRWNALGVNLLRETDIKRKIELNQVKRQIEILSTFMPDEILNMPLSELDEVHTFVGVLLFADVSGFTPLCEKYTKSGKGGIYRLTATLNAYIGALVEVITFYGGDILKFSGDAFLALWKAPPEARLYEIIHNVIVCALFIQQTLGCFETEVNVLLKVKLAIACGNLTFSVIGNETYRHYILTGQAVEDVKDVEKVTVSGDVVVAPSAWGHLAPDNYEITRAEGGNVKIWNCVYFPNHASLQEEYKKKSRVAYDLCVKHLNHRHQLHEKKRIDDATTDSKITDGFIASLPERPSVNSASLHWIPDDLNPFIVRPVESQVEEKQPIEYLTEMRQVTIQFINIIPSTFEDKKLVPMVNKAYQIVCNIVSKVRGVVNKVSLFDKDCMILVLFGLRGIEHEIESQNALKSAFEIRKSIRKLGSVSSISIGITNGLVYCGVVGHPFRREYTVIGGAVNKAARMMCTYEGKVTCDHETYKSCKLSSLYFQLQSVFKLKGIQEAGHIFEYNEDFDKMKMKETQEMPLIGRASEMGVVDIIIKQPKSAGFCGVCFKAEPQTGKSKVLQETLKRYSKGRPTAFLSLNDGLRRQYYTASNIYRQLFDRAATKPERVENLPRNLWDFNEVMETSRSYGSIENNIPSNCSDEALETNMLQMLKVLKKPLLIIDNVEFIDGKSLELLEVCVKKCAVTLVCAGSVEESNTWATMWKLSTISNVKTVTMQPLTSEEITYLMCQFLNVQGLSKKLIYLVNKTCEGRPGFVQAILLKMINNGELEVKYCLTSEADYAFLNTTVGKSIVLVAGFSKKYAEHGEETSTAVTLDLFDSFSPYQQLIIKTAAVLGDIFTRTILIVLLKYPNETMLATAIKTLYEEEVFDCASRYVSSGGLQEKNNVCLCYMDDEEYDVDSELPQYAFCKVLHFKGRTIKLLAYELLPQNQKKELHLRITDLLENQNNLCPNCLRDNSASIITLRKFKDLIRSCQDQKYLTSERKADEYNLTEEYKQIIRDIVHGKSSKGSKKNAETPKRRMWDPTVCFCLEILSKVYRDLIHHSHCAQHLGKKIFFMLEYCNILYTMNHFDEAIPILHEASELCMVQTDKSYFFTGSFKTMMMGKIHFLLGYIYLKKRNVTAAKNHAILSLRQYNVPLISFRYSLPHLLLNKWWFLRYAHEFRSGVEHHTSLIKIDFALCLGLISKIYAFAGQTELAKCAIGRSVACLKFTNPNLDVLCDIYSSAVHLYSLSGDMHVCEKLERCFNKELIRYYASDPSLDLLSVSAVTTMLFFVKLRTGHIVDSIPIGYRTVNIQLTLQAYYSLLTTLPLLVIALIKMKKIVDAVYMVKILYNIGRKYHFSGFIVYYALCAEIILTTNFVVEPFENIERFATNLFQSRREYYNYGFLLLFNVYCYYLRYSPHLAKAWIEAHYGNNNKSVPYARGLLQTTVLCRYLECLLISRVRSKELSVDVSTGHNPLVFLREVERRAKPEPFFLPRIWHLKAYHARIENNLSRAMKYLKKACKYASQQSNVLEECWAITHSTAWFGGYCYDRRLPRHFDWRESNSYTPLQWSHVMHPLPLL